MKHNQTNFGLYIHVPFCSQICHYCDFAKTANWDETLVNRYFQFLQRELSIWKRDYIKPNNLKLGSVYLGGGTPGLFAKEYEPFVELLSDILADDYEFTIEANPKDLDESKLAIWKSSRINRVSLGVQSFHESGLKFLTRNHSSKEALQKVDLLQKYFSNYSLDFIYGWNDQTILDWEKDLRTIEEIEPPHLSLYSLIYEAKTPLGRAYQRGKIVSKEEGFYADCFKLACDRLNHAGYIHEEVSNWAKKSFLAKHNSLYWTNGSFIAIGSGACAYIPEEESKIGLRYSNHSQVRPYIKQNEINLSTFKYRCFQLNNPSLFLEERTNESWLLEYVGSSFRSLYGVNLELIYDITGKKFQPTEIIQQALDTNKITSTGGFVFLSTREWIRETAWCCELLASFI